MDNVLITTTKTIDKHLEALKQVFIVLVQKLELWIEKYSFLYRYRIPKISRNKGRNQTIGALRLNQRPKTKESVQIANSSNSNKRNYL